MRILSPIHVGFLSQICCTFCLRKVSSLGRSRMERSLKGGKHLRWWKFMAFIYPWQWWWDCGSRGQGLRAQQMLLPNYHNPFALSWLGSHFCSLWLTCSIRSGGAKESCDSSLLMSLCGCVVLSTASPLVSYSSSKECVQGECRGERLVLGQLQTYYHTVRRVWIWSIVS